MLDRFDDLKNITFLLKTSLWYMHRVVLQQLQPAPIVAPEKNDTFLILEFDIGTLKSPRVYNHHEGNDWSLCFSRLKSSPFWLVLGFSLFRFLARLDTV